MELLFSELPPTKQIIQFLQQHPQLVAQQKPLYTPQKIMMLLQYRNLDLLKQEFQSHGQKGINLKTFIWLMKHAIPYDQQEKYQLFYSLVRLFKEIDIDSNHYLQWNEFIAYIIQGVKQSHNRSYQNSANLSQQQILENAYALKTKTFTNSEVAKDATTDRASLIKLVLEITQKKTVLCLQQQKNFIRFYDINTLKQRVSQRIYIPQSTNVSKYIVSFTYGDNYLVVMTSSKQIYFYDYNTSETLQPLSIASKIITFSQQTDVYYLLQHNLFLTTNSQYKIKSLTRPAAKRGKMIQGEQICFTAHQNQITTIRELHQPFCIVTSSMDGTIKMWDLKNRKNIIAILKDPQSDKLIKRGVKGFDISYNNVIVSWGFESYMNIWTPQKSLVSPFSGQLKGSTGMIISAKCIKKTTMLVSIDNKNNVRVWQLKRSQCIQVLSCETKGHDIITVQGGFIVYGQRMVVYQKSKQLLKLQNQKQRKTIPTNIFFNSFYSVIIITTINEIRIYNAKNGILLGVYNIIFDDAHDSTIFSCFCKAKTSRKIYIGNSEGGIGLVNIKNGANLKSIRKSNKQDVIITQMYFFSRQDILVVISDKIQNYDQQLLQSHLVKTLTVNHQNQPQTHLQFSEQLLIFITVCLDRFYVWSFQTSKLLHAEQVHDQIVGVKFFKGYLGFIICMKNKLLIYKINLSLDAFQFIFNINFNNTPIVKNTISSILVFNDDKIVQYQGLKIYQKNKTSNNKSQVQFTHIQKKILQNYQKSRNTTQRVKILIGDLFGKLTVFDITPFIQFFQISKITIPKNIKYFLFKRLEVLNLEQTIQNILKERPKRAYQESINNLQYFTVITQAHKAQINNIIYLSQISAIATCSFDQSVKIFTTYGQQLCHLDLHKLKVHKWNIRKPWVQQKIQQFTEVMELLNNMQSQIIRDQYKDKLISRFLINLYFTKQQKEKLKNNRRKYNTISNGNSSPTKRLLNVSIKKGSKMQLSNKSETQRLKQQIPNQNISKLKKREKQSIRQNRNQQQKQILKVKKITQKQVPFEFQKQQLNAQLNKIFIKNKQLNNNQTSANRPRSQTVKRTLSQNRIIKITTKDFIKNIISVKQLNSKKILPQDQQKQTQLVKGTIFKRGQSQKLMKSATKIAADSFFTQSQKNKNMDILLYKKIGKVFQTTLSGFNKYK